MLDGFTDVSEILRGGVYALLWRGEVVYVGQSKSMLSRVAAHKKQFGQRTPEWFPIKGVRFDRIMVRYEHPDRIDALERQLIDLYKPRANRALKSPGPTRQVIELEYQGHRLKLNENAA